MRALVAAGLAVFLLVAAAGPHVHTAAAGAEGCAVCVVGHGAVAEPATPELLPLPLVPGAPDPAPGLSPVVGAPLGAVPGQSPPAAS